jgi:electron transfer flavoprotein beta subunit
MKIVVCVKQISHTYVRTGIDPGSDFIAPEDHVFMINPYDEAALGLALHLKELAGNGEITLLTLGPIIAEMELGRCLAMGADHLCQIDASGRIDPWIKSVLLAKAVDHIGADIILCGKESIDSRNGQVGALLAHHLEMPYVARIRDVSVDENQGSVEVKTSAGRGMSEIVAVSLPAVFSVDASSAPAIFPTYEAKKMSRSFPMQKMFFDHSTIFPKTSCTKIFTPRPRPKVVPAPDSALDAYDRINFLLTGSKVEKKGEMLRGDPESLVEGIISFLEEQGFLESFKVLPKKE